jgi:alanine racemase
MRSWLEVSLGRIRGNYRAVKAAVGPDVDVMPVVKADAYGHGALQVARVLEQEGAPWLAVSSVEEGACLRAQGIQTRILVMADFLPENRAGFRACGLTPVIHSLADLAAVDVPYHLKIDTGMGRLGTRAAPEEVARAVTACRQPLEGVMTHFASSANFDSRQTDEQIARFEAVLAALRAAGHEPRWVHASSTNSVAYPRREAWGNLVRPGHAIYGYVSAARGGGKPALDVHPALSWKATVLALNDVEEGARIGYGGIHIAERPMRIAILAAGYADGIPHRLGNRGHVIVQGRLAPIVGAVSMDLTTIDVTDCPGVKVGDVALLLGEQGGVSINAQQMAKTAQTISYSVLCGISARVKRVYVD